MSKKKAPTPLPKRISAKEKTNLWNQDNLFQQNPQPSTIHRIFKALLVRLTLVGLFPVFVIEAIVGRFFRHD